MLRCLYTASTGELYGVVDYDVYHFSKASGGQYDFSLSGEKIGTLLTGTSMCKMEDNGITILIVDGSVNGYTINISPEAVDENGDPIPVDQFALVHNPQFYGANSIAYLDGFLILNRPGTNQFYVTEFLSTNFDSLDFASKNSAPDKLIAVGAVKQVLYLFGASTTEIWFNSGETFPFARMPGALINYGCESADSLAICDSSLVWLSRNDQGRAIILKTVGYDAVRISTHAIENEISKYSDLSNAVAYSYQEDGHTFYVISFPSGDKTWVFDFASGEWHERLWMDEHGRLHRHRSICHAFAYGRHIVGDWENDNVYIMSKDAATDAGNEILRLRSFPHMVDDGNRVKYNSFMLSMSAGDDDLNIDVGPTPPPAVGNYIFALGSITANTSDFYTFNSQDEVLEKFSVTPSPLTGATAQGRGVSLTTYMMATACSLTPFLRLYNQVDWTAISLSNPLSMASGDGVSFSNDGERVALVGSRTGGGSQPVGYIYDNLGNQEHIILSAVTGADLVDASWSPEDNFLAVSGSGVTILNTTSWATSGSLASGRYIDFHPDGELLAVTGTVNNLDIYSFPGLALQLFPAIKPSVTCLDCAFSPDGNYLAVGMQSSPFLTIYRTSDWTAISLPSPAPVNIVYSIDWTSDSRYLLITDAGGTPQFKVYRVDGWQKLDDPVESPVSVNIQSISVATL